MLVLIGVDSGARATWARESKIAYLRCWFSKLKLIQSL